MLNMMLLGSVSFLQFPVYKKFCPCSDKLSFIQEDCRAKFVIQSFWIKLRNVSLTSFPHLCCPEMKQLNRAI